MSDKQPYRDYHDYQSAFMAGQIHYQLSPDYARFVNDSIEKMLRNAIFEAVKQAEGQWICVQVEQLQIPRSEIGVEYRAHIHVKDPATMPERIYMWFGYAREIPADYHHCPQCGGHTRTDMYGKCAVCGSPRIESHDHS